MVVATIKRPGGECSAGIFLADPIAFRLSMRSACTTGTAVGGNSNGATPWEENSAGVAGAGVTQQAFAGSSQHGSTFCLQQSR
jgi:hypothetical protein